MKPQVIFRLLLYLGCVLFAVPLALFAYAGFFARYWADDYCYNAVLTAQGFWRGQWVFYATTSDRYSVIPLVGISEWFGEWSIRLWPMLAIGLAVGAATWALDAILIRLGRCRFEVFKRHLANNGVMTLLGHAPYPWNLMELLRRIAPILLLVEAGVFFTLWQAANRFQILYWRTGMLTYWMPLVCLAVLAAGILIWRPIGRGRIAILALWAFWTGGFSETTAALQVGLIGVGWLCALVLWRSNWRPILPLGSPYVWGAALLGTLLAMAALYLSPANSGRLSHMPQSADLWTLVTLSMRFGIDFMLERLVSQPLPTLVWVSISGVVGMMDQWGDKTSARQRLWRILIAFGAAYGLIVCSIAPSVWIQVAYPEARAQIPALAVWVTALGAVSWQAGALLARWFQSKPRWVWLVLAVLSISLLYPLRTAPLLWDEAAWLQQRAAEWDVRHLEIRALRAQGETDVTIDALDSIARLMELTPDADLWPNTCIASFYNLHSITGQ